MFSVQHMPLGENLAALRSRQKLTLDDLEERSGVDRAVIHAIEKRRSKASKHAAALALALNVSLDDLLGPTVPGVSSAPPPLPPRDFQDRHEVTDSDWGLLQDVHFLMTDEEVEKLRERALRMRRIAQEQFETVIATAPPPEASSQPSTGKLRGKVLHADGAPMMPLRKEAKK